MNDMDQILPVVKTVVKKISKVTKKHRKTVLKTPVNKRFLTVFDLKMESLFLRHIEKSL